ncbi:Glycoside hydrolase family 19 catalytic [Arabidopsis thaliana x Arabidopsis arenosa]|uniref:Glycoside hydrolase family 19 catalytic n=1 Tax=Arabidopsis thaliana x Arabidopsis arenosa TaxID=1240361 RepID=A0A8T1ZMP5_9BRAS|nr:Glycoside hydrolase family 19 catalytic [Arabidopsis thaliana x Arabidopsis arenosa]
MAFTKISLVLFICLLDPCRGAGTPTPSGGGSVSSIVTQEFFNNIINQASNGCMGKRFYTRDSFIAAANSFPNFSNSVTRREIATMFAHFTHETRHFCYIKRRNRETRPYCNHPAEARDCITPPPGIGYCKHPSDYDDCKRPPAGKGQVRRGQSFSLHLLRQSELVASSPTVTFRTGLGLWMNSVRPVLNQGFGATIRAINGMECNGGNSRSVNARIGYYKAYCGQLGVDPGPNLSC